MFIEDFNELFFCDNCRDLIWLIIIIINIKIKMYVTDASGKVVRF